MGCKITVKQQQLQDSMQSEDFVMLKDKVDKYLLNYQKDVEMRKRNKFTRDAEDYRSGKVYRWRNMTSNDYMSEGYLSTDSSGSERRRPNEYYPFFRRGRGRPRGRRGGQVAATGERGGTVQTRSQVRIPPL